MKQWTIRGEYIQLDQLLKKYDVISSGGQIGSYLAENEVTLNGTPVHEKRKKIRPGDTLRLTGEDIQILGED